MNDIGNEIGSVSIINLPINEDRRGNLSFIEENVHIPFKIKRVFYLYDVPGGAERAGHALKTCHQFLIALSGSFNVQVNDGKRTTKFSLSRSYYGLHLPPMHWRKIDDFSSGSVCLVLASEMYDENNYHRTYEEYIEALSNLNS